MRLLTTSKGLLASTPINPEQVALQRGQLGQR
jgi:hypothetical protein